MCPQPNEAEAGEVWHRRHVPIHHLLRKARIPVLPTFWQSLAQYTEHPILHFAREHPNPRKSDCTHYCFPESSVYRWLLQIMYAALMGYGGQG